jgi:hypothetical protein
MIATASIVSLYPARHIANFVAHAIAKVQDGLVLDHAGCLKECMPLFPWDEETSGGDIFVLPLS